MRCERCEQVEGVAVRRAKMVERDRRAAVVTGARVQERPAGGERWLSFDIAEMLDELLRRLIASGADTATTHWDQLRLVSRMSILRNVSRLS